jgi:hypothetical protein
MKVLVTGATGFLGRRLCERLHHEGHEIVALSRDPDRARERIPVLAGAHRWEALTAEPPREAFEGLPAVVHLAGETIAGRWTSAKKRKIYESRVDGTRYLVDGLAQLDADERPRVLISASAVGYYGDRGDELLTEDSPPGTGFLSKVCQDWQCEAQRAEEMGLRVVQLRFGIVLGRDGGALQTMLPLFKLGLGGPLGSGRQWWSWVHRDDVVGLIEFALQNEELSGSANATAPEPVRQKEFARTLGRVLKRPAVLPAPAFALKLALGEFANELLASTRAIPKRAHELGYHFEYPELEGALCQILGH